MDDVVTQPEWTVGHSSRTAAIAAAFIDMWNEGELPAVLLIHRKLCGVNFGAECDCGPEIIRSVEVDQ